MKQFDWDESKRLANLSKHEIDFDDVAMIFEDERSVSYLSPRDGEERFVIIGMLGGRFISVVYTQRGKTTRIISARTARPQEKSLWLKQNQ